MGTPSRVWRLLFRGALATYPREFRDRFGASMLQAFEERLAARRATSPPLDAFSFGVQAWANTLANGVAERARSWRLSRQHARRAPFWREPGQDLRFAVRMLRRKPAVAALSILTLAVGIGATATVYALVDVALLRPLALPDPDRLVAITETLRGTPSAASYDNLRDWHRETKAFAAIAGFRPQSVNLTGLDRPDRVRGGFVSGGFFTVAGVPVAQGRPLRPEDDDPGAAPVVVINDTFWQRHFGGAPGVLGRVVQLNNVGFEIVGVMPAGFTFPFDGAEVWMSARHMPGTLSRSARSFTVFGRLRPGVSIPQGQADLAAIAASLATTHPATNTDRGVAITGLHEWLTSDGIQPLTLVFVLVLVLLAAAAANVTSLQVGAMTNRRAEIAIRLALGAGRRRLVRQLLTEQLVLATIAGALGVLLASWLLPFAASGMPLVIYGIDRATLDGRVLLFAAAITIGAGLAGGLIPAWHWATRATAESLRGTSRSTGDRRATRTRAVLVSLQVGMAAVLLVASGLVVKSYLAVLAIDPGFRGDRVVTMEYRLPANKYATPASQAAFHEAVVERVRAVPGVATAAVARGVPLSGNGDLIGYLGEQASPQDPPRQAVLNTVSGDYFRALGIPMKRGRTCDARDRADAPAVAVVSERFAREAWPGEDPLGRTIVIAGSDRRPQVIGVVGDLQQFRVTDEPRQAIYACNAQNPGLFMTVVAEIGGSGDPLANVEEIRRAVWAVDPDQPVWKERTLGSLQAASSRGSRFLFVALTIFATSALLLVIAGLYGVVSNSVSQQSREIGVRMALGASRAGILREVLARGLRMTTVGLVVGLAGAVAASNLLTGLLYRTSALDVTPYLLTTIALAAIALVACYAPARRAASIDPADALRDR